MNDPTNVCSGPMQPLDHETKVDPKIPSPTEIPSSAQNWRQVWLIDAEVKGEERDELTAAIEKLSREPPGSAILTVLQRAIDDGRVTRIEMEKPGQVVEDIRKIPREDGTIPDEDDPGYLITELVNRVSRLEETFVQTVNNHAKMIRNMDVMFNNEAKITKTLDMMGRKLAAIDKWTGFSNPDSAGVDKEEGGSE